MKRDCHKSIWIYEIADALTREIIQQMTGIVLYRQEGPHQNVDMKALDAVCGRVSGECQMQLRFWAEPRLFSRMASNMIGEQPQSIEEVQEYATEIFNVLCGRFISEYYEATHMPARFFPTRYETAPDLPDLGEVKPANMLYFTSEQQEIAIFSWTNMSAKLD